MDQLQHPELRGWLQFTAELRTEAERLWQELDSDQLLWKPDAKSWGVADCFEHLVVTHDLYSPKISAAVERGAQASKRISEPVRTSFFGRLFLKAVDPEYTGKNPAPKSFQPTRSGTAEDVVEQFTDRIGRLEDFIRRADGLDFNRVKVTSPAFFLLRFHLGECLLIQVRHHQRHLQQALRVTRHPQFPPQSQISST